LYEKDQSVPENSLEAFSAAAAAGYGMELDLTITKDNRIVVFHDNSLMRACGVNRGIGDCTFDELKDCRLFGTDESIPLFSSLLALVDGRVPLIVELKHTKRYRELCAGAATLLDGYNGLYCVESFDPRIVRWFKKNRPGIVRGQLANGIKSYGQTPWYQALLMSSLLANAYSRPHFVAYQHREARGKLGLFAYKLLGGTLVAWTVRDTDNVSKIKRVFRVIIFEFFRPQSNF
jgi:glycerophosphoryl diester phosphodiesterase